MIQNNVVVNIVVWDGIAEWNPGSQFILVDITNNPEVSTAFIYDGVNFIAPVEIVWP